MSDKLKNKKALVTGAGKRIGREIALELGRHGCDLIVHYNSSEKGAEEVVNTLHSLGQEAFAVKLDFKKPEAAFELATFVKEKFGQLDILINNASTYPSAEKLESNHDFLNETLEEWNNAISVNTRTPFFLIQHLYPLLSESPNGQIINLLDLNFASHLKSRSAYAVSKASLKYITEFTSKVLRPNITVTGLELGPILPPEQMPEAEKNSVNWSGVEKVLENILKTVF